MLREHVTCRRDELTFSYPAKGGTEIVRALVDDQALTVVNTPAVCRASYIDPRVFELFEQGRTIAPVLTRLGEHGTSGNRPSKERSRRRFSTCWTADSDPPSKGLRSTLYT
ncbi:hypothetical protein ACFYO2_32930 [Streptomyces sp. NPDC006602]|uniref:hypothetical protein n=1 Tax=Streptomyces sp. NPDC006602 TaxID=3364751 RepID=UPI0036AFCB6B